MNTIFKVISCIFMLISVTYGTKYYCSQNETIQLKENEIVFFESIGYPFYNLKLWCTIKFSMNQPSRNRKLVLAFNIIDMLHDPFIFHIDDSFDFEYFIYPGQDHEGPEINTVIGYAANLDTTNGCPLEAIGSPYVISDETEIIYIRSTYFENVPRKQACLWKFKSTVQYGFKVVVQIFDISSTTKFRIRNSTELFVVNDLVVIDHPYYNNDNYIELLLSLGDSNYVTEIEFQAYISIFKKEFHYVDAFCNFSLSQNGFLWSNDFNFGYQNNARCSYSFDLLYNMQLTGYAVALNIENNADVLQYTIDYNVTSLITYPSEEFIIRSFKETKNVLFEFISDGSLPFSGFGIFFSTVSFIYRTYILSEENPSCNIFISKCTLVNELITVEVTDETEHHGFMIYISKTFMIEIYNNESLTINLSSKNCFPSSTAYTCKLENFQRFVILSASDEPGDAFIHVRLLKKTSGCIFENNAFVAIKDVEHITGIAGSEDECVVTLLLDSGEDFEEYYLISHLFTTAAKENVKIYIGNDTTQLLLSFNSYTMAKWCNIGLFTKLYTIHIPRNSTFYMTITSYSPTPSEYYILPLFQYPYSSIISTPNLNTLLNSASGFGGFLFFKAEENVCVKFTVFYYNTDDSSFYFEDVETNNVVYVENGGTYIFKDQYIGLSYRGGSTENNGIIFLVETFICDVAIA